jgi:hypothetical protein
MQSRDNLGKIYYILPYIIKTVAAKCVATRGGSCWKIPASRHPLNSPLTEQKVALCATNKIGLRLVRVRDTSTTTNFRLFTLGFSFLAYSFNRDPALKHVPP